MGVSSPGKRRTVGVCALLLVAALGVRVAFGPSLHCSDDLMYRSLGHDLVEGRYEIENHFSARVAFTSALAACERLFGVGRYSGAAFPLACSLLMVGAVFWATARIGSLGAAAAAAALVACTADNVYWGSIAQTEVPAAALMTISGLLFLRCAEGPRWSVLAGAALGGAYLIRENSILLFAFFGLAWLMRMCRLRDVVVVGAMLVGVMSAEALVMWAVTGDPLKRFAVMHGASYSPAVVAYYTPDPVYRFTLAIPSMLFNPFDPQAPHFGLLFPAAAVATIHLLWKREAWVKPMLVWWAAVFAALTFAPYSFKPLLPALAAYPPYFEPLVAPAAIVLGMYAASGGFLRQLLLCVVLATGLLSAEIMQEDSRVRVEGPQKAYEKISAERAVTVSDPRTAALFRYWNGFREKERFQVFPESPDALARGTCVVVDERWIEAQNAWYGYQPPEWIDAPPNGREILYFVTAGRPRVRRPWERPVSGNVTIVYRIERP